MGFDPPPAASAAQRIKRLVAALQASGGMAEGKFLAIGHALERAVAILAALAAAFDALLAEMQGSAVTEARQDLTAAAADAVVLADAPSANAAGLARLTTMSGSIGGCMHAMGRIVRDIDVLAMNARLIAAGMGGAGSDFLDFAGAIRRSANLAQTRLDAVTHELTDLDTHLEAARSGVATFLNCHQESLRAIPVRLTAALAALHAQDRLAAAATATVGHRLSDAYNEVAAMIVALQLGDITRQRVEHMVIAATGLQMLAEQPNGGRNGLVALGSRIAAAQLRDTADELDLEAERIAARLAGLAEGARAIGRLSAQTYGGADHAHSHCMAKLAEDVRDTQTLFERVCLARDETERRIAGVLDAAGRLVAHIRTLGRIEADIRIMGLNTTLKCSRLGSIGRPLSVIAQELRDGGGQVMLQASMASEQVQQLVALAGSLTSTWPAAIGTDAGLEDGAQPASPNGSGAGEVVGDQMLAAFGCLSHAGEALANALGELQRDSVTASGLLETAAAGFSVHRDISEVLRSSADALSALAEEAVDADINSTSRNALLAQFAATYTMAREREVHRRFAPDAPLDVPTAADALEDMLF